MTFHSGRQLTQIPSLFASVRDGMSFCVMLGMGELYLGAFAIYLGASPWQIGLLGMFPLCLAAPGQWLGYKLNEWLGKRRQLLVVGSMMQALIWIPMAMLACGVWSIQPVTSLLIFAALHYILGAFVVPAWNSLMGDLVPSTSRGSYFGYRSRMCGLALLFSMGLGGFLLQGGKITGKEALVFTILFLSATVMRLISSYWLSCHDNPEYQSSREAGVSPSRFIRDLTRTALGKYVVFTGGVRGICQLDSPFYALYMLQHLQFSYGAFMLISVTGVSMQFVLSQVWGDLSDRVGNRRILAVCSVGLVFMPLFWILTHDITFLVLVQAVTGFFWAGFNLASVNFMFDAVERKDRARITAYSTAVTSACCAVGGIFGALLMEGFLSGNSLLWQTSERGAYFSIFGISAALRLLFVTTTLRSLSEVREVEQVSNTELVIRISQVRPLAGATFVAIRQGRQKLSQVGMRRRRPVADVPEVVVPDISVNSDLNRTEFISVVAVEETR